MVTDEKIKFTDAEISLTRHINTDEIEKFNWQTRNENGKGFIYDDKQKLSGRLIAQIPADEANMLIALKDLDYMSFRLNHDKNALRRLLKRFPHWVTAEGGI